MSDEIPQNDPGRAAWLEEELASAKLWPLDTWPHTVRTLIAEIRRLDAELEATWKVLKDFDHTGRKEPLSSCAEVAVAAYANLEHSRNCSINRCNGLEKALNEARDLLTNADDVVIAGNSAAGDLLGEVVALIDNAEIVIDAALEKKS